ncbi:CotH kinase family protein [Pirellulaceae bacterium]|nr:CotH kinase family protein [Pirellulaceae bacterium]
MKNTVKTVLVSVTVWAICFPSHCSPIGAEELSVGDLFPTDRLIQVHVTLAQTDWDKIRYQTRTFFTALDESRKNSPPDSPYTYVDASVVIDGVEYPHVGVRKKGFIGSQSSDRPSLKIKLDYVDKDAEIDGLSVLTLNNNKQDRTQLSQFMTYRFFNTIGSPAPQCCLAKVFVNGVSLGVYSHVESAKKPLVKRGFNTSKGTLFEGTVVDFYEGWEMAFERKFGKEKFGRKQIRNVIEAIKGEEGDKLVSKESSGKAWVPLDDGQGTDWAAVEYDDQQWLSGVNGAGFEIGKGYQDDINQSFNLKEQLYRKGTSVYLRFGFDVADIQKVQSQKLFLKMKYDDGFVAYLNGTQLLSVNAPEKPAWDSKSTTSHPDAAASVFERFDITAHLDKLTETNNVLAIHGMNQSASSGDMLFVVELESSDYDKIKEIFNHVDENAFYQFWAAESLLGFWDGYSANRNNFFFYVHPESEKIHFVPWGTDSLFQKTSPLDRDPRLPLSVKTNGIISHLVYQTSSGRQHYKKVLFDLLEDFWNEEEMIDEIVRLEEIIRPHLHRIQQQRFSTRPMQEFIKQRRPEILEEVKDGMPIFKRKPPELPLLKNPRR